MSMTDKAIAYAYLADVLKNATPDGEALRDVAGVRLTGARVEKIKGRIDIEVARARSRYVDFLNKAGHETT